MMESRPQVGDRVRMVESKLPACRAFAGNLGEVVAVNEHTATIKFDGGETHDVAWPCLKKL